MVGYPSFALLALSLTLACGGGRDERGDTGPDIQTSITLGATGGVDDEGDDEGDSDGLSLDLGGGATANGDEGGGCTPGTLDATLTGTVYAPNLEIPISGAVVYITAQDPEPVPDGVYCAECVGIPCDAQFVLTAADGSFALPASSGPGQKLIVQKGQFLHVADIDVAPGDNAIAPADSNLPGRWDPAAGLWIPRIAVVNTDWDTIYNILAKIGLGDVDGGGELVGGSARFDLLGQPEGGSLLDDLDAMRKYHIIFVPCMAQENMGGLSDQRLQNIRDWVAEGGKWYVTDWANEYLFEAFPSYQTMHQQASDPDLDLYDTTGTVLDGELLAWLQALPAALKDIGNGAPNLFSLPQVELVDNWSGVDAIPSVIVQDDEGNDVDVGHHPWVEGPCVTCDTTATRPMTISAEYGCGRMMFSTYHTNEIAHPGLTPQELILLYIILEIGVCHEDTPPEPPPAG